jgi:hypothetical protein
MSPSHPSSPRYICSKDSKHIRVGVTAENRRYPRFELTKPSSGLFQGLSSAELVAFLTITSFSSSCNREIPKARKNTPKKRDRKSHLATMKYSHFIATKAMRQTPVNSVPKTDTFILNERISTLLCLETPTTLAEATKHSILAEYTSYVKPMY